jgi:antitoxin Phd
MKANTWQLQQAKNHFSEVVAQACASGVQTITKHGKPVAVIVALGDFETLKSRKAKKRKSLLEVLRRCPAPEIFEHIEKSRREPDFGRTIGYR